MNKCSFGLHDWDKWEAYKREIIYLFTVSIGEKIKNYEIRQKRSCRRCGKLQDQLIRRDDGYF